MPREWRFGGRSAGSPTQCASADAGRLPTEVADAFVDRAPIDWAALLTRAQSPADRAIFQNLRILDRVRSAAPAIPPISSAALPRSRIVRLVLALAALQTVCGLCAVGAAVVSGVVVDRTPQIVLAMAFSAACLLLRAVSSDDRRSMFLIATFASAASAFTRSAVTGLPEPRLALLDMLFRGLVPEAFGPAALWQFAVDFPHVRRFAVFDRVARRATDAAWLLGAVLFAANLSATHDPAGPWPAAFLDRNHPANLFWHLYALAVLPAIAAILLRSRRAPAPERRKVARFAVAFAAGTAPFLLCGIARLMLPRVDQWFLMPGAQRAWLDAIIIGALTATPIISTAAVIVDRPFDFQAIRSSPSRARLVRAALTATAAAPFVALCLALYRLRGVAIADIVSSSRAWAALTWAAMGLLLVLIRSRLLGAIGGRVDHRERLAAALERVRVTRGVREIAEVLERELCRGTGGDTIRVLVRTGAGTFVDPSRRAGPLHSSSVLIAMLGEVVAPLDLSRGSLRRLLPPRDSEWVRANGVELAAALKARDATVAAVIVVGPKRGDRPFDRRDRWFVRALTAAASAVWAADSFAGPSHEVAFECPRCGVVADSTPLVCGCRTDAVLSALPRDLGRKFIVERRIGAGGMGVVYVARDAALGRYVALKTLPDLREGTAPRLRDEARAMAALNHESLATIYGLEIWRRTPVLVVEYFPSGTLAQRLAIGPLSPASAVALAMRLAQALTYMHARGVLHRDLKPSNIGFTATGAPKLLDFGLATLIGPTATGAGGAADPGTLAGTRAYLPPEAYRGAPANPRFDLWALAIVLLEAIVGQNPFATGDRPRRIGPPIAADFADLRARTAGLPVLHAFFARALALEPAVRFQTSVELEAALEAIAPALES